MSTSKIEWTEVTTSRRNSRGPRGAESCWHAATPGDSLHAIALGDQ